MSKMFCFWDLHLHNSCRDFSAQVMLLLCLSPRLQELGTTQLIVLPWSLQLFPAPLSEGVFEFSFVG